MEYYQQAAESIRSGQETPIQILKHAGLTAIGGGAATAGSKAIGKLMPAIGALINEYVPEKFSIAGLKKIDPRFGKFIDGALSEGYSYDDIRNFLGEKLQKTQDQEKKYTENAKTNRNIIEQYSPELHQFILKEMQNGRSPIEAGAIASLDRKGETSFKNIIKKITKDHNSPWSAILQSVYGMQKEEQKSPNPPEQQQQPQQGGSGQQALMAILEKINQRLGQ